MGRRLLGNFNHQTLVQVLNTMPRLANSSLKTLGWSSRGSELSNGKGGKHNKMGTLSLMAKKGIASSSKSSE